MTQPPPNIADWIAADPARRLWHPAGLIIWNYHPKLGLQVDGAPYAGLSADLLHQCLVDLLRDAARRQARHLELEAQSYQSLVAEMLAIRDGIER